MAAFFCPTSMGYLLLLYLTPCVSFSSSGTTSPPPSPEPWQTAFFARASPAWQSARLCLMLRPARFCPKCTDAFLWTYFPGGALMWFLRSARPARWWKRSILSTLTRTAGCACRRCSVMLQFTGKTRWFFPRCSSFFFNPGHGALRLSLKKCPWKLWIPLPPRVPLLKLAACRTLSTTSWRIEPFPTHNSWAQAFLLGPLPPAHTPPRAALTKDDCCIVPVTAVQKNFASAALAPVILGSCCCILTLLAFWKTRIPSTVATSHPAGVLPFRPPEPALPLTWSHRVSAILAFGSKTALSCRSSISLVVAFWWFHGLFWSYRF